MVVAAAGGADVVTGAAAAGAMPAPCRSRATELSVVARKGVALRMAASHVGAREEATAPAPEVASFTLPARLQPQVPTHHQPTMQFA